MNRELIAQRLYSNGLLTDFTSLTDVVKNTVGIQSQVQRHAEINIALRCPTASHSGLTKLYIEQKLIRSWANRWTLHLFTYEDWELLINARQTEKLPNNYFLGEKDLALAVVELLTDELGLCKALTREDINTIINEEFPHFDLKSYQIYSVFHELARRGVAYIDASSSAQNPKFVFAENFKHLSTENAIAQLIPRYLTGFSPASLEDFVKWSGIKIGLARKVWDSLDIEPVKVDRNLIDLIAGKTLIAARFDSLLTGYLDKTWLTPAEHFSDMWTSNGILNAPIIHDGVLVGTWTYKVTENSIKFDKKLWAACDESQLPMKFEWIANFLEKKMQG